MKKFRTASLLESLKTDTRQIILQTNYLLHEDPELLLQQPGENRWSVVQVIEHLNSYGRYYLPRIGNSLAGAKESPTDFYRPGWLGDYFTKSMLPKSNGQVTNKMQAPKGHRPSTDIDSNTALDEFLKQEHDLLEFLDKAGKADLQNIRIPISLSRFIKLQLGDTFRFLVAHHQRHFVQVQKTLREVKESRTQVLRLHGV